MIAAHPYLFANLPLFAVVFAILFLGRRRLFARLALYSGLACLPWSLVALLHGEYWRPARFGGGPIGVEDLVFTFTAGAVVWLCSAWPYRGDLRASPHLPASRLAQRALLWGLPAGDLAWAAAFAMLWPVIIASALEVEFRPAGASVASS